MKCPGGFGFMVTLLWGAFAWFIFATYLTHFRPQDSYTFSSTSGPIDVGGYFTLGSLCDTSLPLPRGRLASDEGYDRVKYRKKNCVYPRLPPAGEAIDTVSPDEKDDEHNVIGDKNSGREIITEHAKMQKFSTSDTFRIQLGVLEHDNTALPLKAKDILIDREVSYTDSTEIEFSNFTFPKKMRDKFTLTPRQRSGNLKMLSKTSKETRLFLHFQIVIPVVASSPSSSGEQQVEVVNHKTVRLIQLCDAGSRMTRDLMNRSTVVQNAEEARSDELLAIGDNSTGSSNGSVIFQEGGAKDQKAALAVKLVEATNKKSADEAAKRERERLALERSASDSEELTGRCWISPVHFMVAQPSAQGIDLSTANQQVLNALQQDLRTHHYHSSTPSSSSSSRNTMVNSLYSEEGLSLYNPLVSPDHRVVPSTWHAPLTTNPHRRTPTLEVVITPVSLGWFAMHKTWLLVLDQYESLDSNLEDMVIDTFSIRKMKARMVEMGLAYVHSLMAIFAFRNDVSFFNKKTIHVGVSRAAVIGFALQSVVSLLYLHDTPEINSLVLFMHAIETLIAFWKVFKVVTAAKRPSPESPPPSADAAVKDDQPIENNDDEKKKKKKKKDEKGAEGEKGTADHHVDKERSEKASPPPQPLTAAAAGASRGYTDEEIAGFDTQAIKAVGSVSAVLFSGYLYYTLHHDVHRSWWSWFITSAAHASYAWGFVLMTPQLWVNFKLKSVAHLPWRAMVYKAFGTFADDVYAVMVPGVPLAYRLACLRDDVVFVLLLLQLWWYPTDKSRANEYGVSFEPDTTTTTPAADVSADSNHKDEDRNNVPKEASSKSEEENKDSR